MAEKYIFFEAKLYQRHENWQRLLIVRILLHRSSLWKVWCIPETFLVSYQQTILIKSNWPSHTEVLNTLGVASDGCNRLRGVHCVDAPDLGAVMLKMIQRTSEYWTNNDATDFFGCYLLTYYRSAYWVRKRVSERAGQPVNKMGETRYFRS